MATDDVSKQRERTETVTLVVKFRRQTCGDGPGSSDSRSWRASLENVQTGERRYCESYACIEDVFSRHGFSDDAPAPRSKIAALAERLLARLAGRPQRGS